MDGRVRAPSDGGRRNVCVFFTDVLLCLFFDLTLIFFPDFFNVVFFNFFNYLLTNPEIQFLPLKQKPNLQM